MSLKKLTDEQVLELFRKYEEQITGIFVETAKESGYTVPDENEIKVYELWDNFLCYSPDFSDGIVESIEDSTGMEDLGFKDING